MNLFENLRKIAPKRYVAMVIGHIFMTFGIALLSWCGAGNAALPSMFMTMSMRFPISYGNVTLIIHTCFFIVELIWGRQYIQVGTIFNWVCFGYLTDGWLYLFQKIEYHGNIILFLICLLIGLAFFTFGIAVYQAADVGIGPYDVLPLIVCNKTGWKFYGVRLFFDSLVFIIALILGGWGYHQIGIVTILSAVGIGPLVSFFTEKLINPIMKINK